MAEDLNETHLKRLIDTNEKICLFLIQKSPLIKSRQWEGKRGKGKESPERKTVGEKGREMLTFVPVFFFPPFCPVGVPLW
jgi:hypothetical protein